MPIRLSLLTVVLALVGCTTGSEGTKTVKPVPAPETADYRAIAISSDTFDAIARVESQGDPLQVARTEAKLADTFYSEAKNLPKTVAFLRAGIQYSLGKAQAVAAQDAPLATHLRRAAAEMSYNLASFTWPGWNEPGIAVTGSDIAVGLDAARCHMRLAKELHFDHKQMLNGYWILGAQQLASGQYDEALGSFRQCEAEAQLAKDKESGLMARGYQSVVQIVAGREVEKARQSLARVSAELKALGTEDAKTYLDQFDPVIKALTSQHKTP